MTRLFLLFALAVLVPCTARAEIGALGPDGTVITKDNYPLQQALRSIATPPGLLHFDLNVDQRVTSGSSPRFTLSADYGVGAGFGITAGAYLWGAYGGFAQSTWQFSRNAALRLLGGYDLYDQTVQHNVTVLVHGSLQPETLTESESLGVHRTFAELGLPLKFLMPHMPLAVHALDTVFIFEYETTQPTAANAAGGELPGTRTITQGVLPAWLEYSPLRYFTVAAGGTGYIYNDATSGADSTIRLFGSLNGTFPWFDAGIGYEHYFYLRPSAAGLDELWVYVDVRVWR